ncbi:hypothetical protein OAB57_01300 [Bacteriovoracaceae bacterium]|nr:hypothetical protein [Bacteriovoracaceae bacterium]
MSSSKYSENNQLFHLVISTQKQHSAFIYFCLEATEGICFYKTLKHAPHAQDRQIDIKGSIEFHNDLKNLLKQLTKKFTISVISESVIFDIKKDA